jgi:exopolysaccharide production protein ExoQ
MISYKASSLKNLITCIPLFIIVIFLCDAFSPTMELRQAILTRDLDGTLSAQSVGSMFKQIFWISLFCFSFITYIKYGGLKVKFGINLLLFIAVFSFFLISIFWSQYPLLVAKRLILQVIIASVIFFSLANIKSEKKIMDVVFYGFLFIAIYNLLFIIFYSEYGIDAAGAWSGIHKGKNYLGFVSLSAIIFSIHKYSQAPIFFDKKVALFAVVIWTALLMLSQSKTCIAIYLMFLMFWISNNTQKYLSVFLRCIYFLLFFICIFMPVVSFIFYGEWAYLYELIFSKVTLTGRGGIWLMTLASIKESPTLGVGYGSFWGVGEIPYYFDVKFSFLRFVNQSHNGYLDLAIQVGFIGIIIIFIYLFVFMKIEFKRLPLGLKFIVVFALLHNFTESSLFRDTHLVWVLLLIPLVYSFVDFKMQVNNGHK